MDLVVRVYNVSSGFPSREEYGLKAQIRRAAISVPSNIAEGLTRRSSKEKIHFLNIADSSLSEIDTQLEISRHLGLIDDEVFEGSERMMMEVQKLPAAS